MDSIRASRAGRASRASAARVVFVLLAAHAAGAQAFLDDLLIPHPVHSQPGLVQGQGPYRRAVFDQVYGNPNTGYANSRPVLYQLFPWMQPQQQQGSLGGLGTTTYVTQGTSNPLANFFPWLPWPGNSNRQPLVQSAGAQQPLQPPQQQAAVWSLLPWNNNNNGQQQPGSPGPVLSFFQNSAGTLFPWNRPGSGAAGAGAVYETPVMPTLQVLRPQPSDTNKVTLAATAPAPSSPSLSSLLIAEPQKVTPTAAAAEDGAGAMATVVLEDGMLHQMPARDVSGVRGITGIALQPCH